MWGIHSLIFENIKSGKPDLILFLCQTSNIIDVSIYSEKICYESELKLQQLIVLMALHKIKLNFTWKYFLVTGILFVIYNYWHSHPEFCIVFVECIVILESTFMIISMCGISISLIQTNRDLQKIMWKLGFNNNELYLYFTLYK